GAAVGFLLAMCRSPVYKARTSLEIQENRQNPLEALNTGAGDYDLQTQVKLIQSDSLIDRVMPKLTVRQPSVLDSGPAFWWRRVLGLSSPTAAYLRRKALEMAAGTLKVSSGKEGQTESRILEVTCNSTDPQLVADFLNVLVDEYIKWCQED